MPWKIVIDPDCCTASSGCQKCAIACQNYCEGLCPPVIITTKKGIPIIGSDCRDPNCKECAVSCSQGAIQIWGISKQDQATA